MQVKELLMNIRQLRKLVLETISEGKTKKSRNGNVRRRQLKQIMEKANLAVNEASVSTHMDADLKGSEGSHKGDLFTTGNLPELPPAEWERVIAGAAESLGIEFSGTPESVTVKECAPTQSEIGVEQSLANPMSGNSYSADGIMISSEIEMKKNLPSGGYAGEAKKAAIAKATELGVEGDYQEHSPSGEANFEFDPPIILAEVKSEGMPGDAKYGIMDGHHRWSQAYMVNPDAKITAIIARAPEYSADDFLQAIHLAVGALKANSEGGEISDGASSLVKKAKGENLLKDGAEAIAPVADIVLAKGQIGYNSAADGFNTPIGRILAGGLDDAANDEDKAEQIRMAAVVAHFKATAALVKNVGAYRGAPTRLGMPQADDVLGDGGGTNVLNALANDKVYAPASGSDSKSKKDVEEEEEETVQEEANQFNGRTLNEGVNKTNDVLLNRWKKLAGLK